MKYALILCSLLVLLASDITAARAQLKFSSEERRIITLTDERRNADSLIAYLSSPEIKVAWRAAIGIGNIGDTTVRSALLEHLLIETRDSVADAEAFALGLLGQDAATFYKLKSATASHPTLQRLLALSRIAPKGESATSAATLCGMLGEEHKIDRLTEAKAYGEAAQHKATSPRMLGDIDRIATDDNPEVRWRAAYVFARSGDSLGLIAHMARLRELLNDQGSSYTRMFAVSALARIHDSASELTLYRAYKGEEDWRVRVNILNAFLKFPVLDSLIFEVILNATLASRADDPLSIHIGLIAQQVLEQFIIAQKIPNSRMPELRAWLDEFNGADGRQGDVAPVVCAAATPSAARIGTPTLQSAIATYAQSNDLTQRNIAMHAIGLTMDTTYFAALLRSMPAVGPLEQLARLEALDSMWQRAQHDPLFMKHITDNKFANTYRYVLIRISDADLNPAIVVTALDHLCDSTIIIDTTFHNDAARYLLKYLGRFSEEQFRDQFLATVKAVAWLHDSSPQSVHFLEKEYDSARSWRDEELMDSIKSTLRSFGVSISNLPPALPRVSHIDWGGLESLPDKMVISFENGTVELKLLPYYAPLTVLNMVKLAKEQLFGGQIVHRVVPNFVIQSGDPSGTGYGGPGFTIRTESTPLEYDREGMVGMASDGKDTEGSQWFITESPTPFLNTRYTIWAEVVSGMNTVMKVNQGKKVDAMMPFR
jgi:cyclophilin family peptidyl-prolyl cis-trans isomerase/HEAT repeat protein